MHPTELLMQASVSRKTRYIGVHINKWQPLTGTGQCEGRHRAQISTELPSGGGGVRQVHLDTPLAVPVQLWPQWLSGPGKGQCRGNSPPTDGHFKLHSHALRELRPECDCSPMNCAQTGGISIGGIPLVPVGSGACSSGPRCASRRKASW